MEESDGEKNDSSLRDPLLEDLVSTAPQRKTNFFHRTNSFLLLQLLLIITYTITFYLLSSSECHLNKSSEESISGFFPIRKDLKYTPQLFQKHGNKLSPYAQSPSSSTSEAWSHILSGGNMRIHPSELPLNTTSVPLADNSGDSLAKMAFYHELHCLFTLKTHLYPSFYFPNASESFFEEEKEHLEHCIEWIRVAAICRGDTTLTLFEWQDERLVTKYPVPHMCVDEEKLLGWTKANGRMVDIDQEGVLVGPSGERSRLHGGE